jgi:hypothetical protein
VNDLEFERSLRASLRYGAEQVRMPAVGFDPLIDDGPFEDEIRASLRTGAARTRPLRRRLVSIPRRERNHRRWLLEGLVAAVVIVLVGGVLALTVFTPQPSPISGPAVPVATPWRISVQVVPMHGNGPGQVGDVTAPANSHVRLVVTVAPAHPDGKTYLLRSFDGGPWRRVGPHNTDAHSRERLLVRVPTAGHTEVYQVYVAAAAGHLGTYSSPITIRGGS